MGQIIIMSSAEIDSLGLFTVLFKYYEPLASNVRSTNTAVEVNWYMFLFRQALFRQSLFRQFLFRHAIIHDRILCIMLNSNLALHSAPCGEIIVSVTPNEQSSTIS